MSKFFDLIDQINLTVHSAVVPDTELISQIESTVSGLRRVGTPQTNMIASTAYNAMQAAIKNQYAGKVARNTELKKIAVWVSAIQLGWI